MAFAMPAIAGAAAVTPTIGTFASLAIILFGLGMYRYGVRLLKRQMRRESSAAPAKLVCKPVFAAGLPAAQPAFIIAPNPIKPRSADRVRGDLYWRLGTSSPLSSP